MQTSAAVILTRQAGKKKSNDTPLQPDASLPPVCDEESLKVKVSDDDNDDDV